MNNTEDNIELLVFSYFESNEEIKKTKISLQEIHNVMSNIDWQHFHLVILSRNDNDWIEVGGNLNKAGLSCMYEINGEQFVIDEEPSSVIQMIDILNSYYHNDGEFLRTNKFTGQEEEKKKKEEDLKKYNDWKKNFEIESKKDKKDNFRKFILVVIIMFLISFISYNWITGELKFFGQKTEYSKAKIVNTQMQHFGKGFYFQIVTYEFYYNDKKYLGNFRAWDGIGKQKTGGFVKVKFSITNPNRSLMKGIYKRSRNY